MANATNDRSPLTEQDIEPVEELLRTLKSKAREAHTAGNALLLSFYVDLIKVVSPRVGRLHARVERETLASIRKEHKTLKQHGRA